MKEFRKIAIGLLGLTHPELFVPRRATSEARADFAKAAASATPGSATTIPAAGFLRALRFFIAALAIGSRTVPMADHGELLRDLKAQAGHLYGPDPN